MDNTIEYRCVLIRSDGIEEIKKLYKAPDYIPLDVVMWPDGTYGKFLKISRQGRLFFKQITAEEANELINWKDRKST